MVLCDVYPRPRPPRTAQHALLCISAISRTSCHISHSPSPPTHSARLCKCINNKNNKYPDEAVQNQFFDYVTICNLVPDAICDDLAVSAAVTLNTGVNVTVVPDDATLNDNIGLSAAGVADITVATQFVDVRETGSTIPAAVSSAATHDNETVPPGDGEVISVSRYNVSYTWIYCTYFMWRRIN